MGIIEDFRSKINMGLLNETRLEKTDSNSLYLRQTNSEIEAINNQRKVLNGIHNIKMIRRYRNKSGFHRKAVNKLWYSCTMDDLKNVRFYDSIYNYLEVNRKEISKKNKVLKPKWIQM